MSTDTLTFQYTTKRRESFHGGYCYNVPDLGPQHVITPRSQQSTRATLWLSCRDADIRKTRRVAALKAIGLDGYEVHEDNADLPGVTIEPLGNGFMARITLTLPV